MIYPQGPETISFDMLINWTAVGNSWELWHPYCRGPDHHCRCNLACIRKDSLGPRSPLSCSSCSARGGKLHHRAAPPSRCTESQNTLQAKSILWEIMERGGSSRGCFDQFRQSDSDLSDSQWLPLNLYSIKHILTDRNRCSPPKTAPNEPS